MRVKRISLHKNRAVQCPEATGSHVGIWMVLSGQVAYQTSLEVNLLRSFERLELFKFASDLTPPAQEHRNLTIITLNPEQNFLNTKTKPLKYSSSFELLTTFLSNFIRFGLRVLKCHENIFSFFSCRCIERHCRCGNNKSMQHFQYGKGVYSVIYEKYTAIRSYVHYRVIILPKIVSNFNLKCSDYPFDTDLVMVSMNRHRSTTCWSNSVNLFM